MRDRWHGPGVSPERPLNASLVLVTGHLAPPRIPARLRQPATLVFGRPGSAGAPGRWSGRLRVGVSPPRPPPRSRGPTTPLERWTRFRRQMTATPLGVLWCGQPPRGTESPRGAWRATPPAGEPRLLPESHASCRRACPQSDERGRGAAEAQPAEEDHAVTGKDGQGLGPLTGGLGTVPRVGHGSTPDPGDATAAWGPRGVDPLPRAGSKLAPRSGSGSRPRPGQSRAQVSAEAREQGRLGSRQEQRTVTLMTPDAPAFLLPRVRSVSCPRTRWQTRGHRESPPCFSGEILQFWLLHRGAFNGLRISLFPSGLGVGSSPTVCEEPTPSR